MNEVYNYLCSSGDHYLLDPCREEEKICRGFVSLSFFEDCKLAQVKHTGKQHCSVRISIQTNITTACHSTCSNVHLM